MFKSRNFFSSLRSPSFDCRHQTISRLPCIEIRPVEVLQNDMLIGTAGSSFDTILDYYAIPRVESGFSTPSCSAL